MFEPKQNWATLSAIQLGGTISLPVFLTGYFLGCHYSRETAITQLIIGNILLLAVSFAYLRVIVVYRVITMDMANFIFGKMGASVAGMSMLVSMLGWTAIQWQFMKNAASHLGADQGDFLRFILQGSSSNISVPVFYGLIMVLSLGGGMLFDLPTFYRHARTKRHGRVSLIFLWLIAVLGMESLGLMVAENQGALHWVDQHKPIIFSLIVVTGVLSNMVNIYSGSMVIHRLFAYRLKVAAMVMLAISLIVSLIPIGVHLPVFLEFMGASAEVVLCVTLTTVFIHGLSLETCSMAEKKVNQQIYFLTMLFMFLAYASGLSWFNNVVADVAVICVSLMLIYDGVKKYEAKNKVC